MEEVTLRATSGVPYTVGLIQDDYYFGKVHGVRQYAPCYDHRYIPVLAESIRDYPRRKFDCNIMVTGKRRRGKTTLATKIARQVDAEFRPTNVAFEVEPWNKVLADSPYADPDNDIYPQSMLDEAGFDLFSQNWMERIQRNIVKKLEVIGIKNLIDWFILPHRKKLNKSIREEMIEYWLHVGLSRDGLRGIAELRQGVENIWEEEMYWAPVCAFTFEDHPKDDPWWMTYEVSKREFVDKVTATDPTDEAMSDRGRKLIDQRNAAIKLLYRIGYGSHATIARALEMPRTTIDSILKGL